MERRNKGGRLRLQPKANAPLIADPLYQPPPEVVLEPKKPSAKRKATAKKEPKRLKAKPIMSKSRGAGDRGGSRKGGGRKGGRS